MGTKVIDRVRVMVACVCICGVYVKHVACGVNGRDMGRMGRLWC